MTIFWGDAKSPSMKMLGLFGLPVRRGPLPAQGPPEAGFLLFGGGHFFGFAFLAHQFEFAFGFFVGLGYFLLDALGRFL